MTSDDTINREFKNASEKKAEMIRDKDNAEPRVKPPSQARKPAPNKAPPGHVGIRLGLGQSSSLPAPKATPHPDITNEPPKPPGPSKRFGFNPRKTLRDTFQPLANPSKDRGHER